RLRRGAGRVLTTYPSWPREGEWAPSSKDPWGETSPKLATFQRSRILFAPPYPKAALSPSQKLVIVCSTPPFAGTYASTPSSSPFDGTEYLSRANRTFLAAALPIPRCTFILRPWTVTPVPGG